MLAIVYKQISQIWETDIEVFYKNTCRTITTNVNNPQSYLGRAIQSELTGRVQLVIGGRPELTI